MTSNNDAIAIYHEMRRRDTFEQTAGILWCIIRMAAREHPGQPRKLYMDIEGHTLAALKGEYDDDARELIAFTRAALGPFLTTTPWGKTEEGPQREDIPEVMAIGPKPDDERICILTGDKNRPVRWDRVKS